MWTHKQKFFLVALISLNTVFAFAYVTDSAVYPPPADYTNPPLPGVGASHRYQDPVFDATSQTPDWIWRVTDALNTPRADGVPGNVMTMTHEYSTTSPFNSDRTRLLLIHRAYFALYDGDGNFVRNLFFVCPSCAPRWSRTNPDVFYYRRGLQLYQYDARQNVNTPLGNPLPYDAAYGKGEDDICLDGDHLVGFGRRGSDYFLFVFSISQAAIASERSIGGFSDFANIDSAEIAPDDIVIVSYVAVDRFAQALAYRGIWAFDLALNPLRQVATAEGHHDLGRDSDGSPVLVITNSGSYFPLAQCRNGIEKISINDPYNRQCLISLQWTMAVHISLPDEAPGSAFVETYTPRDPIYGGLSRKEEVSPSIYSTGQAGWNLDINTAFSGGRAIWSDNDRSQITFWFYGTKVRWIGYKDSASGIADVTLDGETSSVDLYSDSPSAESEVVYSRENLPLTFHQLSIDVTTKKNDLSTGYKVWLDAIDDDTPWAPYTNELLLMKLDGTEIRRLAHHRSRPFDKYNYQPRVSASRDGRKLVFESNYGVLNQSYAPYTDVYMMSVN